MQLLFQKEQSDTFSDKIYLWHYIGEVDETTFHQWIVTPSISFERKTNSAFLFADSKGKTNLKFILHFNTKNIQEFDVKNQNIIWFGYDNGQWIVTNVTIA